MNNFETVFNYDDVFLRIKTLGVIEEFYRKVRWINRWDHSEKLVTIPTYYGLIGDDRFLIDLFVDEIVGKRPELNIDPIPRANIVIENTLIKRSEYANPNVNIEYFKEENGILKKYMGKMRFLPVKTTYSMDIILSKEIELMKCQESLWQFFFAYKYFYIKYKNIRIDAILDIPDEKTYEILRDLNTPPAKDDIMKHIKFNFDVHSYYPIEPIETPPIIATNCNRVIFKGNTRSLNINTDKRIFIGGNINNKCKK